MSSIIYLRLDANNDVNFDVNAQLSDLEAVAQAIKTRILLFEGEWWENLNEGTPMFQEILGAPATPNNQSIMAAALSARIGQTPYVSSVENVTVNFDPKTRQFSYSAKVQTAFGSTQITIDPGATSSLGG